MTTTATEAGELVDLTKRLWPRRGLTDDQAIIWWDRLQRYGMVNVLKAISESYATDLESAKPANEPRYRQIRDIAYRLSQADHDRRRIGADCHPDNEHPEIRDIRHWWESWRRDNKIECPEWAAEILDEHAAKGVALRVWQQWSQASQDYWRFQYSWLAWVEYDERRRLEGENSAAIRPLTSRPADGAAAIILPALHKRLLDLPTVHYKTEAVKEQWLDRVEFAASEFEVELEGATKGHVKDEVPF